MGTIRSNMSAPAAVATTQFGQPSVRYGRPTFDFAAAPSLFVAEDLRQEDFALAHRNNVNSVLAQSEVFEAEAVAVRRAKEGEAAEALAEERHAARYAAETREIERASVSQRASLEAKFRDAEMAAQAAAAQAEEYRQMLASATAEHLSSALPSHPDPLTTQMAASVALLLTLLAMVLSLPSRPSPTVAAQWLLCKAVS